MSTNIYIDGFNLYNGRVKGTPYKWLDLHAMCQMLLPNHEINRIRYFTAHLMGYEHDPGAPQRQDVYLRALRTLPTVEVHDRAFFTAHPVLLPQFPLAYPYTEHPRQKPPQMVQVQRTEEKQTDVNIAVQLMLDYFNGDGDEYVVISNDADMVPAIEIVRDRFHRTITVIVGCQRNWTLLRPRKPRRLGVVEAPSEG